MASAAEAAEGPEAELVTGAAATEAAAMEAAVGSEAVGLGSEAGGSAAGNFEGIDDDDSAEEAGDDGEDSD